MCVCVCLYFEPVSRTKNYVRSRIKIGSVVCLYILVSPSVPEMEGMYATGGILFWECTFGGVYTPCIYSHARWSYVGDSDLCWYATLSVERYYFPLLKVYKIRQHQNVSAALTCLQTDITKGVDVHLSGSWPQSHPEVGQSRVGVHKARPANRVRSNVCAVRQLGLRIINGMRGQVKWHLSLKGSRPQNNLMAKWNDSARFNSKS